MGVNSSIIFTSVLCIDYSLPDQNLLEVVNSILYHQILKLAAFSTSNGPFETKSDFKDIKKLFKILN